MFAKFYGTPDSTKTRFYMCNVNQKMTGSRFVGGFPFGICDRYYFVTFTVNTFSVVLPAASFTTDFTSQLVAVPGLNAADFVV